jgi:hypothetical protein
VLKDKKKIEIYDIEDVEFSNWPVKAIRVLK